MLSGGVPHEFRNSRAVIHRTEESHCSVSILDETGRFGVGECWPNFFDVTLLSTTLRLNNRVVVDGCSGPQTRWLNGHAATIVSHKREGHPCFVRSKRHLNRPPQFNVCICLEQPPSPGDRLVLIEPRFLSEYDIFAMEATNRLGAVVRQVSGSSDGELGSLMGTPRCAASVPDFDTPRCCWLSDSATPTVALSSDCPATASCLHLASVPASQAPAVAQELFAHDLAASTPAPVCPESWRDDSNVDTMPPGTCPIADSEAAPVDATVLGAETEAESAGTAAEGAPLRAFAPNSSPSNDFLCCCCFCRSRSEGEWL